MASSISGPSGIAILKETEHTDQFFSQRALELAAAGIGRVSPNPLVGCVIAAANGETVGEGSYVYDGVLHAEAIALEQAGERARGGTAYVSIEPHDHSNRTPPCTEALINAGIKRIVCPIEDPNPLVSGRGFERLRNAGIEVTTGILAAEASRLNEKFICWHTKNRPFVHLKLATSLDGRISLSDSVSTSISDEAGRVLIHEFRHEHDAILVGGNTAAVDNPRLTDRSGLPRRRPLVRVVLDNRLQTPVSSTLVLMAEETPTLVFTNSKDPAKKSALRDRGVDVIELEMGGRDLAEVLSELKKLQIQSVLVEGGSDVAGAFIDARLVDKLTFIAAPFIIGGRKAPPAIGGRGADSIEDAFRLRDLTITSIGEQFEITGYPTS